MNISLRRLARATFLWLLLAASPAWAALSCSITVTPSPVMGIYSWLANLDIPGSFTVTCTRAPGDANLQWIWIGIDQPTGGLSMPRDIGGGALNYTIYRRTYGSAVWTNTGSQSATSTTNGALRVALNFRGGTTVSATYNFYFRVPQWQIFDPAGIYVSAPVPVTLRLNNQAGTVLNSTSISAIISIQNHCRFTSAPLPVSVNYTAFSTTPVVGSSGFSVICTQGTDYTLALDATVGVVPNVEINYTAALSASGTQIGTATAQSYSVTATFPAGQAGRCTGPTCSGTDTRTITVTY